MQFSLYPGPSLIRHNTSKGGVPPSPRQPVNSQTTRSLKLLALAFFLLMVSDWKGIWSFFVGELHCKITRGCLTIIVNELVEQSEIIDEAVEACMKAFHLLEEGLDDKAFAMFDQGMEDFLKAVAVFEKALDDIVKRCNELPPDTQEEIRMSCKRLHGSIKRTRQSMKNLSGYFETLKDTKGDWI
ncbi:hypothetical protein C2845_PM05G19710 [Panicum miliaceum]|uniref:Pectinesterase inhibitor domain-containing protein n=1 Tax=Panicum miliaceum TaxID=4540 RepID=A0A3L6SYY4_PANMI|nr:hypothetical protein C2845_PM05G19710 [Panicum miliaceum]